MHIGLMLAPLTVAGQDVHFSQFFNAPLVLDPSLAGAIDGDQRLGLIYRDQWSSAGSPFRTYALSYDLPLLRGKMDGRYLGVGLSAFRDKAGKSEFGDTKVDLSFTYGLKLGDRSMLAFGIQSGYGQRSAMLSGLRWDSQFNGAGFDPSLGTNEVVADQNTSFLDMAAGVSWRGVFKGGTEFQVGAAAFHLLQPNVSLFGSDRDVLLRRYTVHGGFRFQGEKYTWKPQFFGTQQGASQEIHFGTLVGRRLGQDSRFTTDKTSNAFYLGCFYRWADAVVPMIQFEYKRKLVIGMSYDVNISRLRASTNMQGGFEVTLQWIGAFSDERVDLPNQRAK
ncbi:MAG: PorP/SprF family type IX secretion system membrane protein [Flavobacteriales bacterium]|nr:PorP/SprF family type IX secretion system membrane protein [Flavobacteriales bacterium]